MIGHRTYLDNPRLIGTRSRKEPLPRGHRTWLNVTRVSDTRPKDGDAKLAPLASSAGLKGNAHD